MRTFFNGWRRKVGFVVLVLALLLAGLWTRSFRVQDAINFEAASRQQQILSLNGELCWWGWDAAICSWGLKLSEIPTYKAIERETWAREFTFQDGRREWIVPYWMLTLPPTLLAVYLLLWKLRKQH